MGNVYVREFAFFIENYYILFGWVSQAAECGVQTNSGQCMATCELEFYNVNIIHLSRKHVCGRISALFAHCSDSFTKRRVLEARN